MLWPINSFETLVQTLQFGELFPDNGGYRLLYNFYNLFLIDLHVPNHSTRYNMYLSHNMYFFHNMEHLVFISIMGRIRWCVAFHSHNEIRKCICKIIYRIQIQQKRCFPCECVALRLGNCARSLKVRVDEHKNSGKQGKITSSKLTEYIWTNTHNSLERC